MSLPKAYEPGKYEKGIYDLWEKSGVFTADPKSDKSHFSIAMPPPNETGTLHIGQSLGVTLQDILARHARQRGYDVLLLPGTDHAALATNALVEKQLAEEGTDKHRLGREAFVARIREFVADSRNTINSQVRVLGASADWTRLRYTLDEALNRTVNEVFVKMHQDGLIYRGHRIVNWDPKLETTVSDDELEHQEQTTPLYTLSFGPFQIATARPETKFGDKYVVMHPDDKRYAKYKHGDTFEVDWLAGKITATAIKDEAVEAEFGTGVMTITPWHDRTDFEIAERHGLERDQVIDLQGKLLPIAGEFAGQTIEEARPKIIEMLDKKGLLVKTDEKYVHSIAVNSRGKGVIEPQIMLQWFVDVNRPAVEWKGQKRSLKEVMRAVIEDGDIKITPKRFEKLYFHWIDNLRDWCISRQIWWGHRVPVWYKKTGDSGQVTGDSKEEIYVGVQPPKGPALSNDRSKRSGEADSTGQGWEQDPDTLDTWFSSALWTWSTLIDQELAKDYSLSLDELLAKSEDFQTYHPTDVMETSWDILFFWVARMILATTYATGQIPFKDVYLHSLVRTEAGKKMSKSDPDSIIDPRVMIGEFGTDALRLALAGNATPSTDMRLGRGDVIAGRNFANKLWNIARFAETHFQGGSLEMENTEVKAAPKSPADHWILNKLSISKDGVADDLAKYKFSEAYQKLYHYVWDDLADWYVEASKVEPNPGVLTRMLKASLIMAHPFAPFVTETVWQNLKLGDGLLINHPWPKPPKADMKAAAEFEQVKNIVSEVRRINGMIKEQASRLYFKEPPALGQLIARLAGLKEVKKAPTGYSGGLRLSGSPAAAWLDVDSKEYTNQLAQQLKASQAAVKRLESRLNAPGYKDKAPKELITETKQALDTEQTRSRQLATELQNLKS